MEERVFQKVRDILSEKKGVSTDAISMDSSFEELELDSLDAVELIADLEEAFGVNVPNTDLQKVRTIRDAVEGLGKAMEAKG
jgi:acyl carrier protein